MKDRACKHNISLRCIAGQLLTLSAMYNNAVHFGFGILLLLLLVTMMVEIMALVVELVMTRAVRVPRR